MIQALIFDLDGTLANTEDLHFRSWRDTILHNGADEFTFEQFLNYVGTSNEKVAGDFIQTYNSRKTIEELVKEKQQRYMQLIPEVELFIGAKELIEHFYGKYKLAVASSSHQPEIHAILKHHTLFDKMSVIFGGDMVTNKKPDPEIYLKTAKALNITPTHCIAFEDSNPGITAAKTAEMYTIALPNKYTKDHDFRAADLVLNSFNEFNQQTINRLPTTP